MRPAHELNPAVPELISQMLEQCCREKPEERPDEMQRVDTAAAALADNVEISRAGLESGSIIKRPQSDKDVMLRVHLRASTERTPDKLEALTLLGKC